MVGPSLIMLSASESWATVRNAPSPLFEGLHEFQLHQVPCHACESHVTCLAIHGVAKFPDGVVLGTGQWMASRSISVLLCKAASCCMRVQLCYMCYAAARLDAHGCFLIIMVTFNMQIHVLLQSMGCSANTACCCTLTNRAWSVLCHC